MLYDKADKVLRKFTSRFQLTKKALKLAMMRDTLEGLRMVREQLEVIEKQLEDYLDQKRNIFSRLYFLSDEQLLTLMAQYNNLDYLHQALRHVFSDVYCIQLVQESHQKGTDKSTIVGVESQLGEKLLLNKGVVMGDSVETWFKELQEQLGVTVGKQIKKSLLDLYEVRDNRHEWVNRHCL